VRQKHPHENLSRLTVVRLCSLFRSMGIRRKRRRCMQFLSDYRYQTSCAIHFRSNLSHWWRVRCRERNLRLTQNSAQKTGLSDRADFSEGITAFGAVAISSIGSAWDQLTQTISGTQIEMSWFHTQRSPWLLLPTFCIFIANERANHVRADAIVQFAKTSIYDVSICSMFVVLSGWNHEARSYISATAE
jgi:hypothetical protein